MEQGYALRGLAVALLLCAAGAALAQDAGSGETLPPPRERAERLTWDEKTKTWLSTPEPKPGTEDGDLDVARRQLARAEYQDALKCLVAWIKKYGTDRPRYPEAVYLKAVAELETRDYRAAHDDFQILLNEFPGSPFAEDALESDFRVAEQYLAGKRRKAWRGLLWVKDREGGIKILDDIILNYPDTPLAELAQRTKADYYYGRGEYDVAEDEYATFSREYPRSRFHPYALLQSARAALASFAGIKFDDAGLVEAQERFTEFQKLYPVQSRDADVPISLEQIDSARAEKTLDIARFYEKTSKYGHQARRRQAARFYYRATMERWPETAAAAEARGRLASLGEEVLVELPADEAASRPATQPEAR